MEVLAGTKTDSADVVKGPNGGNNKDRVHTASIGMVITAIAIKCYQQL